MLLSLNTKAVGWTGVAFFAIGLLCQTAFQAALIKALPPGAAPYVSLVFIVAGFAASYFGMPTTVPTSPTSGK